MHKAKHFSGFSGTNLKIIALITMLIDHIGAILLETGLLPQITSSVLGGGSAKYQLSDYTFWVNIDIVLRMIGRLAFPIFCFLLVEGFLHTKSAARYALRLGLFALISEIPFDISIYNQFFANDMQNVFFTLLLGLLALMGMQYAAQLLEQYAPKLRFLSVLPLAVCALLAELLRTDYSAFGVLLIGALYIFRQNRMYQCMIGAIGTIWKVTAPLAFLPVYFYNGERGKLKLKYVFYWFYPLHLLLLGLVRNLLF